MRKVLYILPPIALVLCLVLVLTMTGVWTFPEPTEPPPNTTGNTAGFQGTTQPNSGTDATAPADEIWTPQDMFCISLPKMMDTIVSVDDIILFHHTYQDVVVSSPNPQINKAITLDLLRRMDTNSDIAHQISSLSQYYTPGTPWTTLFYEILYTPTRIDNAVLSLHATESSCYGSAEITRNETCVNYHMATGAVLTLEQILSEESDSQEALLQALLSALGAQEQQLGLFSDYKDTVTRYFQSYLQQESIWYFTDEGLNICFAPYEIAPSSYGTVTAAIPYSDLTGILRSDMLPTPKQSVSLSVDISGFADASLDSYSHFAECILDNEAAPALITTDKILYDVRLELLTQTDGVTESTATVFGSNSLCSSDALMLQYSPSDTRQLMLHCKAGGQQYSFAIIPDEAGGLRFSPIE